MQRNAECSEHSEDAGDDPLGDDQHAGGSRGGGRNGLATKREGAQATKNAEEEELLQEYYIVSSSRVRSTVTIRKTNCGSENDAPRTGQLLFCVDDDHSPATVFMKPLFSPSPPVSSAESPPCSPSPPSTVPSPLPTVASSPATQPIGPTDNHIGYRRFEVHAGREDGREVVDASSLVFGFALSLVLGLLKGLEGKGHTVFMDNYYISPVIAH